MGTAIAFWIMALIAVIAALGVVTLKNVFRAALSLVLCFLMVAGLYVTLSADFLAAAQILIYIGAISVLIILGIMMTGEVQRGNLANKLRVPAFIIGAVFLGLMIFTVVKTPWQIAGTAPTTPTTSSLATLLFTPNGFILPVEMSALLLLAALVGAIVLAREK